jgi:hypothetical protein
VRTSFFALVLLMSGCATNDQGRPWLLDAFMGYTPNAAPQQPQSQGYLPAYSVNGVLLGSMPAQSVTGLMGWSCTYQVTAVTNTRIWLDHQCPPTMQFQ